MCERKISQFFLEREIPKILRKIEQNYNKAKYFNEVCPVIKNVLNIRRYF
ncbi:WbqC family protein [Psychroserpens sp.]